MGIGILGTEQVLERWDTMISGAENMGAQVMDNVKSLLNATKAPDVKIEHKNVSPGVAQLIAGGKRPFIIISTTGGPNLKPYKIYINCRDYGINLQVSWFLVHQIGTAGKIVDAIMRIPVVGLLLLPIFALSKLTASKGTGGIVNLSLFDEQDLRAYATNAHHCVLDAVEILMKDLKQDITKIERRSDGFLGIS